ncbi:hypothetical protein VCHA40P240_10238 [Vibrio chagasii]|nr:hypothetical protein VCHA40P240_10238 [Vibrio chagasii]
MENNSGCGRKFFREPDSYLLLERGKDFLPLPLVKGMQPCSLKCGCFH